MLSVFIVVFSGDKQVIISLSEVVLRVRRDTTPVAALHLCGANHKSASPKLRGGYRCGYAAVIRHHLVVMRLFGNFVAVIVAALPRLFGGYFPVFDGVSFGAKIYADFGDWQPA